MTSTTTRCKLSRLPTGSGSCRRPGITSECSSLVPRAPRVSACSWIGRAPGCPPEPARPPLMKIPRPRQDADIARMADFLRRIVRLLAAVVVERFGRRGAGSHAKFSAERVVGETFKILRAIEQSVGDQMHHLFRAALNTAFDLHQPRAH